MTEDEIDKYINQIAFSGAEEFVQRSTKEKKEQSRLSDILGLGFLFLFYGCRDKVQIKTLILTKKVQKLYNGRALALRSIQLRKLRKNRNWNGYRTIHIRRISRVFQKSNGFREMLDKYCKFLSIPVCLW